MVKVPRKSQAKPVRKKSKNAKPTDITESDVEFVMELIRPYKPAELKLDSGFQNYLHDTLELCREIYDFVKPVTGPVSTGDLKSLRRSVGIVRKQLDRPLVRRRIELGAIDGAVAPLPFSKAFALSDEKLIKDMRVAGAVLDNIVRDLPVLERYVEAAQSAKRQKNAGTMEAKRHAIASAARVLLEFLERGGLPHKLYYKGEEISNAAAIVAETLRQIGIPANERTISELKFKGMPAVDQSDD
jgi:hypothetical protein